MKLLGLLQGRNRNVDIQPGHVGTVAGEEENSIDMDKLCCCFCYSVAQLCPTFCDAIDCSPPGSMEFSQARILKWVAISFSR